LVERLVLSQLLGQGKLESFVSLETLATEGGRDPQLVSGGDGGRCDMTPGNLPQRPHSGPFRIVCLEPKSVNRVLLCQHEGFSCSRTDVLRDFVFNAIDNPFFHVKAISMPEAQNLGSDLFCKLAKDLP